MKKLIKQITKISVLITSIFLSQTQPINCMENTNYNQLDSCCSHLSKISFKEVAPKIKCVTSDGFYFFIPRLTEESGSAVFQGLNNQDIIYLANIHSKSMPMISKLLNQYAELKSSNQIEEVISITFLDLKIDEIEKALLKFNINRPQALITAIKDLLKNIDIQLYEEKFYTILPTAIINSWFNVKDMLKKQIEDLKKDQQKVIEKIKEIKAREEKQKRFNDKLKFSKKSRAKAIHLARQN